jgi:hypothetical protein
MAEHENNVAEQHGTAETENRRLPATAKKNRKKEETAEQMNST